MREVRGGIVLKENEEVGGGEVRGGDVGKGWWRMKVGEA